MSNIQIWVTIVFCQSFFQVKMAFLKKSHSSAWAAWPSWMEHRPCTRRLWVISLVGVCVGGSRLMCVCVCVCVSLSPPSLPSSKVNTHVLRWGLKKHRDSQLRTPGKAQGFSLGQPSYSVWFRLASFCVTENMKNPCSRRLSFNKVIFTASSRTFWSLYFYCFSLFQRVCGSKECDWCGLLPPPWFVLRRQRFHLLLQMTTKCRCRWQMTTKWKGVNNVLVVSRKQFWTQELPETLHHILSATPI